MDPNVLKKLYGTSTATNKAVENIDDTLNKIYKLQEKENKEKNAASKKEATEKRREAQREKRKEREDSNKGIFGKMKPEQKKKEKKGLLDLLKGGIGGLVKGVISGLAGIGSILATSLGGLGLGAMLAGALATVAPVLLAGVAVAVAYHFKKEIREWWNDKQVELNGWQRGVHRQIRSFLGQKVSEEQLIINQKMTQARDKSLGLGITNILNSKEEKEAASKEFEVLQQLSKYLQQRDNMEKQLLDLQEQQTQGAKNDKAIADLETNIKIKRQQIDNIYKADNNVSRPTVQKKQVGGPITVPGVGDGDKVPMMLPQGSFVLNKVASQFAFQTGGMVPTLLEPGEKVFMPGQWDQSISMLNSAIPRFQTGGVVAASHAHTGSGYGIEGVNDYKGRPAVFSKGAAEAFAKMIAESGGAVRGSDLTSTKRSASWNKKVGGVSGSRHLTGNAIDVNSGSSSWHWIKQNGGKYGWKFNNYMGPNGWHFDYRGAKENEGLDGVAGDDKVQQGEILGGLQQMGTAGLDMLGGIGGVLAGVFEGMSDLFGGDIGSIMSGAWSSGTQLMGGIGGLLSGSVGSLVTGLTPAASAATSPQPSLNLGQSTPGGAYGESSLIAALNKAGITNKNERAMFLAQMAHESGNFRYTHEIHDGSNYEGRSDLGNTKPGDGRLFKGRGYIQLTGRANYTKYGKIVGHDLVKNPELAADPNIAADIALAYWNARVNRAAAQKGDVRTVTKNINGGYNGLDDRISKFNRYQSQGLQSGGIVNIKGSKSSMLKRMQEAQATYEQRVAAAGGSGPIVIFEDAPAPTAVSNPTPHATPPALPDGPSSIQAAEYFFNLNMGGNF
ncbi:membrane-bound lytic murein transglycosylase D precursor [Synechococcus phage S-B68]|nr:membrane-bound lytic murein transglycosylase D precursor [Synechococcus phage S-B68]